LQSSTSARLLLFMLAFPAFLRMYALMRTYSFLHVNYQCKTSADSAQLIILLKFSFWKKIKNFANFFPVLSHIHRDFCYCQVLLLAISLSLSLPTSPPPSLSLSRSHYLSFLLPICYAFTYLVVLNLDNKTADGSN
jgi:hypothetical protein